MNGRIGAYSKEHELLDATFYVSKEDRRNIIDAWKELFTGTKAYFQILPVTKYDNDKSLFNINYDETNL